MQINFVEQIKYNIIVKIQRKSCQENYFRYLTYILLCLNYNNYMDVFRNYRCKYVA